MSDYKRQSDQAAASSDAAKARRGVEHIGQLLRRDHQQKVADVNEQTLPYGEIFRQSYAQIPGVLREKLRASEQGDIVEVPVADLPDPPDVTGPENHHITYDNAIHHTRQLNEVVLPWVRAGAVKDDFYALDRAMGNDDDTGQNERSFVRTYELFFGMNPVKLDRTTNGGGSIVDGRHRIYAAKALGLTSLPVRQSRAG